MLRNLMPQHLALCVAIAGVGLASVVSAAGNDPCALLSNAEITKATGLTVGKGTAGPTIPGTLGRCTWVAPGNTRVIVTLADAQHMQLTVKVWQGAKGSEAIPGLGSTAVGVKAAGGYIVSVLDAKGGFGVSILGKEGTRDRAVALAKIVESHR